MKTRFLIAIAACGAASSAVLAQPPKATPVGPKPPEINPAPTDGPGVDILLSAFFAGGASNGGGFELVSVIGQPDAGLMNGGDIGLSGGFLGFIDDGMVCYANCDNSTAPPILNALDFGCFLSKYAAGDTYANCDGSTGAPVLNALDFGCFLTKYAVGCS